MGKIRLEPITGPGTRPYYRAHSNLRPLDLRTPLAQRPYLRASNCLRGRAAHGHHLSREHRTLEA